MSSKRENCDAYVAIKITEREGKINKPGRVGLYAVVQDYSRCGQDMEICDVAFYMQHHPIFCDMNDLFKD